MTEPSGTLGGRVVIDGLPPSRGYIVTLYFFSVSDGDSEPPFSGDPPKSAFIDAAQVAHAVDLNQERNDRSVSIEFSVQRKAGWYFLDVGVILFRNQKGENHAQVEHFFFKKRPVLIPENNTVSLTLPVVWPAIPVENLHRYGVISPKKPT